MNRQIHTGGKAVEQSGITLEVLADAKLGGKQLTKGETITVSKSEARRLLAQDKKVFRVFMD